MTPIILDIGDSYDDFFALAVAACSPEIDLALVTTSLDDGGLRTQVVKTLLQAYGRSDVPVAAGKGSRRDLAFLTACLEQLKRVGIQPARALGACPSKRIETVRHSRGTPDRSTKALPQVMTNGIWSYSDKHLDTDALDLMEQTLTNLKRANLVVTGPLTNVASLLKQFPHVTPYINEVLFMGGWTSQALPEHNVRLDPEATDYVLKQGIPITAAGYEVTRGYRLLRPHSARLKAATAPGPRALNVIYQTWCKMKNLTSPGMLDPFIVAYLCGQIPAEFKTLHVAVDRTHGPGRGAMVPDQEAGYPIRIFSKVDASRYIDFVIDRAVPQARTLPKATNPAQWDVTLRAAYRLRHHPNWTTTKSWQPFHTIALLESGTCEATVSNQDYQLGPGCVLYIPPEEPLSVHSHQGMRTFWFYFHVFEDSVGYGRQPLGALSWPHRVSSGPEREVWTAMAKRVVKYWMHHWPEAALLCKSAFLELFANLCIRAYEQEIQNWGPAQEAALQAKRWIEANVAETITLEDLAQHVLLSKYHLLRVFGELFGIPPLQYQRQLRMQHARRLLSLEHLSVAEVAARVGYQSPTAFARAYKRRYGIAPSQEQRRGYL